MGVLVPQLKSSLSLERRKTAYIVESVGFVPQYPQNLCAFNTTLCIVLVTATRSSIFNYSQDQPGHIKHNFHARVCVCLWGVPCFPFTFYRCVQELEAGPLCWHPICISILSPQHLPLFAGKDVQKERDDLQNGKGFINNESFIFPLRQRQISAAGERNINANGEGLKGAIMCNVWASEHDPLGQLPVYHGF